MYLVTKTYGHELGLSSCFRQPLAESHCRELHGYPLSFKLTFAADQLCRNNWVLNFGGLKPLKAWLCENFDHRTILAQSDPLALDLALIYQRYGFAPINVLPFVGCEGFAKFVFDYVDGDFLTEHFPLDCDIRGLRIEEVECREHAGNSAIYRRNA